MKTRQNWSSTRFWPKQQLSDPAVAAVLLTDGPWPIRPGETPYSLKLVNGQALVARAVHELRRCLGPQATVVVVAAAELVEKVQAVLGAGEARPGSMSVTSVVAGAATSRLELLAVGIDVLTTVLPDESVVVVHDLWRPLVGAPFIGSVVTAALDRGGAAVVPVLAMTETVKIIDAEGVIRSTVPREDLVRVQLPQAAALALIRRRCAEPRSAEAALTLVGGLTGTTLVAGSDDAVPVRTALDLEVVELRARLSEPVADLSWIGD
jgi:2-C-methyl-D-erythritol 4-phosphate cytidylyltransferase